MIKRIALFLVPVALLFTGAQCISFSGGSSANADGGVYKSIDASDHWVGKNAIPSVSGTPRSMASVNILDMIVDPQDPNAFVIGTRENGIFYSFDAGESWNQVALLAKTGVNAVAIDPRDKCTIYAAVASGRIMRSVDCFRTFEEIYRDGARETQITDLQIDAFNPNRIFAATTRGILLRSDTSGRTWSVAQNFSTGSNNNGTIMQLVMNPKESREMYVGITSQGLWKSTDGGATWVDLTPKLRTIAKLDAYPIDFRGMAISPAAPRTLVILNGLFGMLRTTDAGDTWSQVKLLTEPGNVTLRALGLSPQSDKVIYYGTASTFYRTIDGGATWETNRMPTTRIPSVILVDGKDAKKVYMGVLKPKS